MNVVTEDTLALGAAFARAGVDPAEIGHNVLYVRLALRHVETQNRYAAGAVCFYVPYNSPQPSGFFYIQSNKTGSGPLVLEELEIIEYDAETRLLQRVKPIDITKGAVQVRTLFLCRVKGGVWGLPAVLKWFSDGSCLPSRPDLHLHHVNLTEANVLNQLKCLRLLTKEKPGQSGRGRPSGYRLLADFTYDDLQQRYRDARKPSQEEMAEILETSLSHFKRVRNDRGWPWPPE